MFARSLDGLGNCTWQKHCSVTASDEHSGERRGSSLRNRRRGFGNRSWGQCNCSWNARLRPIAPPTKTSLRKWRKRGCCHEDKVQRVMISTWYTNSMSDCLYWWVQFQYWSQLTETVNLLNVAALNRIFSKKAELDNMCVAINISLSHFHFLFLD